MSRVIKAAIWEENPHLIHTPEPPKPEEKAAEALRNIREIEYQMTDSLRNMFESLAGSDFQSIVNTWLDIFKKFGTNFEAAIDKINESIDDMIRNMVTQTVFVQPLMQRLNKYLQDYAANAGLDQDEFGNYIWKSLKTLLSESCW